MRIQFLAGGLANQIRQYVFTRFSERYCPTGDWFLDDSWFWVVPKIHNGYELDRIFPIQVSLLSNYFDQDTWNCVLKQLLRGIAMPQILSDAGIPIALMKGASDCGRFTGVVLERSGLDPKVVRLPYSNVYYHDYWIEDDWFMRFADENRTELVFPELTDSENLKRSDIISSHFSVGIHVRRGDFVELGWNVPEEEYQRSCKSVLDRKPSAYFVIFSDEPEWCKAHEKELGFDLASNTLYIEGNIMGKNYIDMQLMSMCRGIVRPAQSSFSQVAAWLDRNLEFEIKIGKTFN